MAGGVAIEVGVNPADMARIRAAFAALPKRARQVVPRAINRAAAVAQTQAKRILARELGIKQSALTQPHRFGATKGQSTGRALRIKRATPETLEAHLLISGRRIPVIWFKAKQAPVRERKPVRALTSRGWRIVRRRPGGARWRIGSHGATKVKEAFITRMASGHEGVFTRGKGGKLVELYGPSIPHVALQSAELGQALATEVPETLRRRLDHELSRILEDRR